jgi:hypothetical protein
MTKRFEVAFTPADTILYPFRYSLISFGTKEEAEQVCVECALKRQSFALKGTDFVERLTTDIPGAYFVMETVETSQ